MAEIKVLYIDSNGDYVEHSGSGDSLTLAGLTMSGGDIAMAGQNITGLPATPSGDTAATSKSYVDSVATGLDVKDSVKAATTTDLASVNAAFIYTNGNPGSWAAPDGGFTLDGIAIADGDRILVKDEGDPAGDDRGHGIWVYDDSTDTLVRSTDADNTPVNEVSGGMFTFVEQGSSQADTGWVLQSPNGNATLGTDDLNFVQFSSAGVINPGTNLYQSGSDLNVDATNDTVMVGNGLGSAVTDLSVANGDAAADATNRHVRLNAAGTSFIISDGAVANTQVAAAAAIDGSKLVLGTGYADGDATDYTATNSFITTLSGTSTLEVASEEVIAFLESLDDTTTGFSGANKIGYDNGTSGLTATDVKAAIDELADTQAGLDSTSDGAIAAGDVVYPSGAGTVAEWADISVLQRPIGVVETGVATAQPVEVRVSGQKASGLASLTAGAKHYWDGTSITPTIPTTAGQYVYQIGIALSTTELLVDIDLIKKNT